MKAILKLTMSFLLAALVISCNNTEVMLKTTTNLEPAYDVKLSATEIILSENNSKDTVLLVTWKVKPLELNNPDYQLATNAITSIIQLDTVATFGKPTEYTKFDSLFFTGEVLNLYAKNMKLPAGVPTTVFVRIKTTSSPNNPPTFSNVFSFKITPYDTGADYLYIGIGQQIASLSFADNSRLCSRNKDGKYDGFLYAASGWLNFRFTSLANTSGLVYGSVPDQRFMLDDNQTTQWGLWLDEGSGLHYLQVDINAKTWSFVYFSNIYVYGDFNGWNATNTPLVWNAATKTYSATVTFSAANSQFKLVPADKAGTSLWLYQLGSGNVSGELVLNGDNIVNPVAGTFVLTVDVTTNPASYTYTLTPIP